MRCPAACPPAVYIDPRWHARNSGICRLRFPEPVSCSGNSQLTRLWELGSHGPVSSCVSSGPGGMEQAGDKLEPNGWIGDRDEPGRGTGPSDQLSNVMYVRSGQLRSCQVRS